MSNNYILYGSYASYYTAKSRAYLRKKGIGFVERLPSDPLFRSKVRPSSGSHRIPQLLTPEGAVVQDSVEMLDFLEKRFPEIPAFPTTPRQRTFVHLMELLGSEGLVQLAWLHRWMFDANLDFVKMDFGRSFKPQGDDEELMKYGSLIADRMMSYGLPESTPKSRAALDQTYLGLLHCFEQHLIRFPYFLGGHPSAADYAVMGAMHAHMGRDPAGLRLMQIHAPRTFRWVEHMMVPEVQSPEFFDTPIEYLAEDQVPDSALQILRYIATEYGEQFVLGAKAFNQAMQRIGAGPGYELAPNQDQPKLPAEKLEYNGLSLSHSTNLYAEWLGQRARRYFQAQTEDQQRTIETLFDSAQLNALLREPVHYKLTRVNNRLVID